MKNKIFNILTLLLLLASCKQGSNNNTNNLAGLWKLDYMHIEKTKDSTISFLGGMDGYLLYDNKTFMSLHLFPKGYNDFKKQIRNFEQNPDSATANHIAKNYNYTGKYWIEDSLIFHQKLSHSNPNEFGDTSIRIYKILKDSLWMIPTEERNNKLRLKWVRVKN